MFVKHHYIYPEEKEPVSEGESGASSEEQSERHHLHHQHYSHHPGLRVLPSNTLISNGSTVSNMDTLHGTVMSPSNNGGIVQYTTNTDTAGPFFVPSMSTIGSSSGLGSPQDDSSR